jgi:hypothetical protein
MFVGQWYTYVETQKTYMWENLMFYAIREFECSFRTFSKSFMDEKIPFQIFISRPVPSVKIS